MPSQKIRCKNCGDEFRMSGNALHEREDLGWCAACFRTWDKQGRPVDGGDATPLPIDVAHKLILEQQKEEVTTMRDARTDGALGGMMNARDKFMNLVRGGEETTQPEIAAMEYMSGRVVEASYALVNETAMERYRAGPSREDIAKIETALLLQGLGALDDMEG